MQETTTSRIATPQLPASVRLKYCLYARKSTEAEDRQALSIESQIKEMLELAQKDGLEVVETKRESHSSKEVGQRPVFNEMINEVREGKYNAILTWAPDRLSRNAGDLGSVVDLIDQKLLVEIRTHGQRFTNNPNEKFLLMILGSQAKLENDNRVINVKRGLRTRVEMGLWPTTAPTGYLNEKLTDRKCYVIVDPDRSDVIKQMFEKVANDHWSGRKLYHWLKFELNYRTNRNHHLALSNVYLILQNHFYYGRFEYPRNSGNWYTGKHTPLISKELFDRVQEQLKRDHINRETREFAFTKLLTCGLCGSGITAGERYKKLKDVTVSRYVYYGCTRSRDLKCLSQYLREEILIEWLLGIVDTIDMNQFGLKERLKEELERFNKFQTMVGLEKSKSATASNVDLRTFVKYILKEGSMLEKRELLSNMRIKLLLTKDGLTLQK